METPSAADMSSGMQERDGHTIYCAAHCYGAPIPDERTRTLSVLSLSRDGSELRLLQQVPLPEGTLMPISQALNAARTRLFTTAGKNGIACYELDPSDHGKIVGAAVCSAVTPEPFPTPYGVMPVDITLDGKGENAFVCNFLMGTISALSIDMDNRSLSNPKLCAPGHSGIPEKVRKIGPSEAAQALGFPEGFPEDASHPHGITCHPSDKWVVMADLGTNSMSVYALPISASFTSGEADFVLQAHEAPDTNRHHGGGPRQLVFSPDGRTLFCVNELDHTVCAYSFDISTGKLTPVGAPQMTLPQDWLDGTPPRPYMYNAQPNYNSGIAVSPDGCHVYTTGRGHDTVAGFVVSATGSLSPTAQANVGSGGRTPWSLSFASEELLLVSNQNADDPKAREGGGPNADPNRLAPLGKEPGNVTVFRRSLVDGSLTPTGAVWEAPHVISVIAAD